jgi:hypothetical protein
MYSYLDDLAYSYQVDEQQIRTLQRELGLCQMGVVAGVWKEMLTLLGLPPSTRITRLLSFSTAGKGTSFSVIFEYSLRDVQ